MEIGNRVGFRLQPLRCIVGPQRLKPRSWRHRFGTVKTVL